MPATTPEASTSRSPEPALADDLALAQRLADTADALALARFQAADLDVAVKEDASFVTDADRAVERAIVDLLASERPDDAVFGEEFGGSGSAHRRWILDPIDGTSGFLRGMPVWGSLLALAIDGVPVVGVASMPALGRRWWGATGLGAGTRASDGTERAIRVSDVATLERASVSFQSIAQWDEAGRLDALVALTRRVWRDRAYGDLWSYALLAEGVVDAVAEFGTQPYDVAALVPIVREAGGAFTSVDGGDPLVGSAPLASNGVLHAALIDALA